MVTVVSPLISFIFSYAEESWPSVRSLFLMPKVNEMFKQSLHDYSHRTAMGGLEIVHAAFVFTALSEDQREDLTFGEIEKLRSITLGLPVNTALLPQVLIKISVNSFCSGESIADNQCITG